ncbi:hypothetical protein NliqN6_6863 [Naganishia liquefaciens]|uniref:BZIP domain-containing protein n=1 Tax=Naganishia liquefaciens TaxID=104408 RepID=A0A8H3YKE6_9TREE|nr:hypothetical protein NliqN6_6863 [Naganishia liquefaciens]
MNGNGNPLSPDSQAFMDLLERHLQEHDATGQSDDASAPRATFPAAAGMPPAPAAYQPFPTKSSSAASAPSPNTMAALINILQVQAQAQGLDPQTQQRQLAALLGNMPITGGLAGQQQQSVGYPNVQSSQLYVPPSTTYPYPGIDTPEHSSSSGTAKHPQSGIESTGHTPPAGRPSEASSASPEARAPPSAAAGEAYARSRAIHGALEEQARRALDANEGMPHIKRKAGDEEMEGHAAHRSRRGEGEGSEGHDSEDDHEEGKKTSKRSSTAKTSRRKSAAGAGLDAIVTKGDEDLDAKALKRKNQNRAAQKAFRERREARVKDLEDKVSELEAKNAGSEFENENLRQLLAKLQQENMALKNAAFTFSMPMPGATTQSPVGSAQGTTSPDPMQQQRSKIPSPPGPQPLQHRGESTSSSASAASNNVRSQSAGSGSASRSPGASSSSTSVSPFGNGGPQANTVFHPERYNAFASSAAPAGRQLSPGSGQAGFASFGQHQGQSQSQVQAQAPTNSGMSSTAPAVGAGNEMDWQSLLNNNFTMLAQAPEFMSFSDDAAFGNFGGYSDIWPGFSGSAVDGGMAGIESTLASAGNNQFSTMHTKPSVPDDGLMNTIAEDNMEEFLRSLGAGQTPAVGNGDDVFDIGFGAAPADNGDMLRSYVDSTAYKTTSGPSSSSAHSSILSPSNFFTTSPDSSSASSVPSEGKHLSASASPQASESSQHSAAFRVGTFGGRGEEPRATMLRRDGTVVPCTKIIEEVTQRIPINSGFDLDDLCDHFKKKAVCTGNGPQFKEEDADAILSDYAAQRNIKLLSPPTATVPMPQHPPPPNSDLFFR